MGRKKKGDNVKRLTNKAISKIIHLQRKSDTTIPARASLISSSQSVPRCLPVNELSTEDLAKYELYRGFPCVHGHVVRHVRAQFECVERLE